MQRVLGTSRLVMNQLSFDLQIIIFIFICWLCYLNMCLLVWLKAVVIMISNNIDLLTFVKKALSSNICISWISSNIQPYI